MIAGIEGFADRFSRASTVSDDDMIELLFSLSAITGMETTDQYERLIFGFSFKGKKIPLFIFYATGSGEISNTFLADLEDNGIFPFEVSEFLEDIKPFREGTQLLLPRIIDNIGDFIVCVYRMFNEINIYDK